MASSSSSSLHSHQSSACPALPLISCKKCSKKLSELTSGQPESKLRKFYRCSVGCDDFYWQARYAVMLIKNGHAKADQFTDLLMIALDDHSQGLESQSGCIKTVKKDLESMKQELQRTKEELANTKQELHNLKDDLQKLKGPGSATAEPRRMGMCSLSLLLLVILIVLLAILVGWFLIGLNREGTFRQLMLKP